MSDLINELRSVSRSLTRSPRHLILTAGCLALGLGANVSMFTVVDSLFLRQPSGVGHAAGVVRLYFNRHVPVAGAIVNNIASVPILADLRTETSSFSDIAGYYATTVSEGQGVSAAKLRAVLASPNYFRLLETSARLGRAFLPNDSSDASAPIAVLSDAMWRSRFGADKSAIGKRLLIGTRQYTIVGVMPPEFRGVDLEPVDLWLPVEAAANDLIMPGYAKMRGAMALAVIARLAPGVSDARANADATRGFRNSMRAMRGFDPTDNVVVAPLRVDRGPKRSDQAKVSLWLAALSVAVLLIACVNCATLLLLRALRRQGEFALRTALGATRWGLVRLLVVENFVVSLVGAIAAIAVATVATSLLRALLLSPDAALDVSLMRIFGYSVAVATGFGFLMNLPALVAVARENLSTYLRAGARAGTSLRSNLLRNGLLTVQVALTMVLLVGAGLFASSLRNVRSIDMGFRSSGVLVVNLDFFGMSARPSSAAMSDAVFDQISAAVRAVPRVQSVSVATSAPFLNQTNTSVAIPGRDSSLAQVPVSFIAADANYAATIGLRVVSGRWFDPSEYQSGATTAVINEMLAKTLWPGESPLGKCVIAAGPQCRQIVGIVADTRRNDIREDVRSQLYMTEPPVTMATRLPRTLIIRSDRPRAIAKDVRRAIQGVGSNLPFVTVRAFDDIVAAKTRSWELGAFVFSVFGLLALTLASIGLYGSTSSTVAERSHEFGIRLALGASAKNVLTLVTRRVALLVCAGAALGAIGAWWGGALLQALLFGVTPRSAEVFAVAAGLILLATAAACVVPLRGALRASPADALRSV